jgi:ABC-2 type transport system ATP-binding protein
MPNLATFARVVGAKGEDALAPVISLEQLTKSYGPRRGIVELDLEVAAGEVFGYLGPNGAGKTTTIRILLDLIRPTSGQARVFGLETTRHPVAIHRRTGYLPGEFALYDRLTGGETIAYFAHLRGGVDETYQASLIERLDLDPSRPYREYSKGNKQKVGLVVAFHHRPDLLVLDEPTSGLDPLVQQEFFGLVGEARADGRTVFLSSHIVGEVERCCDRAGIIREGRLVRVDRVETLRDLSVHRIEFRFARPVEPGRFARLAGVSRVVCDDRALRMDIRGAIAPAVKLAATFDLLDMSSEEPGLEEVFLAEYRRDADDR